MADPPNCATTTNVCGNTGFCNGMGACAQAATTVSCGAAVNCTGTTFQPPSHCSGTGTCSQTATMDCGVYSCGTNMCKSSCTVDADCSGGAFCVSGSCMAKRPDGGACSGNNFCVNAHCVDNTCCNVASCSTCQACNLNGMGTCSSVGLGTTDPHGRCLASPPCGNTGACNGSGACQQQANTVSCGAAVSCSGFTFQPQSFCSGSGMCGQTSTMNCAGFLNCNAAGTACLTSCNPSNGDNDCIGGTYCTGPNGSCQKKVAAGGSCGANHECTTASCVDNVCCNFGSCGTCQTCNGASPGNCTPLGVVTPESDPHGRCPQNPPCGNTGLCAGGACQQPSSSTSCGSATCASSTSYQPAGTCSGTGACNTPSPQNCLPFLCGAGGCRNSCTGDSECIGAFYCTGNPITPGTCAPKKSNIDNGCTRGAECASGFCTEGFCCDMGPCPQCQSCALPGQHGTCSNVPAHAIDVSGSCPDRGAALCGTNGRCTISGTCELYDLNTVCSTLCTSPIFTTNYCDGIGGCTQSQLVTCDSAVCDVNGCVP
jgi:hypothetical protein